MLKGKRITDRLWSPRLGTLALRAGGMVLAAGTLAVLSQSFDLTAVAAALARANPIWLLPVAGILVIQLALRAIRLRTLLPHHEGAADIDLGSLAGAMLVSNLANNVTPARVGDGVKCYLVSRRHRLPFPAVLGTLMLEHGMDSALLAVITASIALALAATGPLYTFSLVAGVVGLGILSALLVARPLLGARRLLVARPLLGARRLLPRARPLLVARPPFLRGPRRLESNGPALGAGSSRARSALRTAAAHFAHGFTMVRHRRVLLAALSLGVLLWVSDGLLFWLAARSLGLFVNPLAAMFIAAGVALATALPGAPGNVGTLEYMVVAAAAAVGVAGSGVLALAFLVHAIQLVPATVAGIAVVLLDGHKLSVSEAETRAGTAPLAGVSAGGAASTFPWPLDRVTDRASSGQAAEV
jgi:uncharacterized membrane protein YbhN (UPF0104 family)